MMKGLCKSISYVCAIQTSRMCSKSLSSLTPAFLHLAPAAVTIGSNNTSVVNTTVPSRAKRFEHHFLNRWMARDYKRRETVKQYYPLRQRMVVLKKCALLPRDFQEVVGEELHAFPKDSNFNHTNNRCILTSRPRSVNPFYRLSRIQFRLLADYNKLSGVMRAKW